MDEEDVKEPSESMSHADQDNQDDYQPVASSSTTIETQVENRDIFSNKHSDLEEKQDNQGNATFLESSNNLIF